MEALSEQEELRPLHDVVRIYPRVASHNARDAHGNTFARRGWAQVLEAPDSPRDDTRLRDIFEVVLATAGR